METQSVTGDFHACSHVVCTRLSLGGKRDYLWFKMTELIKKTAGNDSLMQYMLQSNQLFVKIMSVVNIYKEMYVTGGGGGGVVRLSLGIHLAYTFHTAPYINYVCNYFILSLYTNCNHERMLQSENCVRD